MAKQLSEKSRIIRAAILANPETGNTRIAEIINDSADRLDDKIKVTAQEVGNQRSALKGKATVPAGSAHKPALVAEVLTPDPAAAPPAATTRSGRPRKKPGRKPGRKPSAPAAARDAVPEVVTSKPVSPVDLVEVVFVLAEQVGGMGQLKRLVDRLAGPRT